MRSYSPSTAERFETSMLMNLNFGFCLRGSMFDSLPVIKLSRAVTSWPSFRSRSHKFEPRKPAPPVIRIFMI